MLKFEHFFAVKNVLTRKSKNLMEVRNSWVTKSSYENVLRKMTSHFELQTQTFF